MAGFPLGGFVFHFLQSHIQKERGDFGRVITEEETGVEPTDPQAVAAAILRLLHNPDEAKRMGRNGYDRAQRLYSLDAYLQNLVEAVRLAQELAELGVMG